MRVRVRVRAYHDVDKELGRGGHRADNVPRLLLGQPALAVELYHLLHLALWEVVELPGLARTLSIVVGVVRGDLERLTAGRVGRPASEQHRVQRQRQLHWPPGRVAQAEHQQADHDTVHSTLQQ